MANTWFVCIDPADKGKPTSYLDTVDFRIQVQPSDPNYNTLQRGGVINWNGQNLIKWKGPFATEDAAKKAQNPKQQSPNPLTDLKNAAANSNLGGLASIGQFFDRLSEASTWIRVGEVLLGLALVIVGAAKLFSNTSVGRAAEKVGKVAMLI